MDTTTVARVRSARKEDHNIKPASRALAMLTILLSTLKYTLIAIGSALGIFAVITDFKIDGKVTRPGRFAIWTMVGVAFLTLAAAGLEQYASYAQARDALERERLGRRLSDLRIEWKLSAEETRAFADAMRPFAFPWSQPADDSSLLYIATAIRGGELAVTQGITGWRVDMFLHRPQGTLARRFGEETPEWRAFERALQHIIGDRLELAFDQGRSIVDIASGAWPMELRLDRSVLAVHLQEPDVSPLELKEAITITHRGQFRPSTIYIASSDPRAPIRQETQLQWRKKVWRTLENREGEREAMYEYVSAIRIDTEKQLRAPDTIRSIKPDVATPTVADRVTAIVAEQLGRQSNTISRQSTLNDLGADELDRVELIMAIEEEFRIEIPDADAGRLDSTGAIIDYITLQLADR